ncbi:hypothetical protein D0Z00_002561 [Geotrichum galactomycetum]|uniref:Uncharacterized protein n=1 Tax=Geotrichum galactomycetum TaxID=27317 RepID=A0ACB6V426_9ASCO|nr:hypothetical protein D0Z00_002561 [Geotrichum candidum]
MEFPSLTNNVPQLVAPRPLKARRHQKSIISLENFSVATTTAVSPAGASTATTSNSGFGNNFTAMDTEMGDYTGNNNGAGGASAASSSFHGGSAGSGNYSDVIPFPSFTSSPSDAGASDQVVSSRYYRSTSSTGQGFYSRPKSLSRKSSLLESWEFQNIRLSGNNIVGDTNVSVLMNNNEFHNNQTGHNSNNNGIESSDSSSGGMQSFDGASYYNTFDDEMQKMPLYSPGHDAVNELFLIMKHTSLSGGDDKPMTPVPTYYSDQAAFHYQSSYPTSASTSLSLSTSMSTGGSGDSLHSGNSYDFIPPSPVARNTRNPIIFSTEFQENQQ